MEALLFGSSLMMVGVILTDTLLDYVSYRRRWSEDSRANWRVRDEKGRFVKGNPYRFKKG